MAINLDGPKKSGKFLKRNSKTLKAVELVEYSFAMLNTEKNIEFDNIDRSIIHHRFHDKEEIERHILESDRLKEALHDPSQPKLNIIMPGDFTQDWFHERATSKRRALGFEDEDDFDFPIPGRGNANQKRQEAIANPATGEQVEQAADVQPSSLQSLAAPEEQIPMDPEELVKHARPVAIVKEPYAKTTDNTSLQGSTPVTAPTPKTAQTVTDRESNFIPLDAQRDSIAISPEEAAMNAYKNMHEMEAANKTLLEELKAKAKSEGYNEGFRTGEEKGVLSGQNTAAEIFKRVAELILEFENLKSNVLNNIQQNFYELSQAVAESLLEREFSINPESFAKVLDKVLKDTVTDNEFKIRLHPDTWQKVTELKVTHLDGHLVKDASIVPGEFKVESKLTVVDGSAKKIVHQMLQNVDMNLFDDIGTNKKVG
jgi:flagellar biosynthesis/type III secretory pathway protein FliH